MPTSFAPMLVRATWSSIPMLRPIREIASEIQDDWSRIPAAASHYLQAMLVLESIEDYYGADPASEVVMRFLSNAGHWRGHKARKLKNELEELLATQSRESRA